MDRKHDIKQNAQRKSIGSLLIAFFILVLPAIPFLDFIKKIYISLSPIIASIIAFVGLSGITAFVVFMYRRLCKLHGDIPTNTLWATMDKIKSDNMLFEEFVGRKSEMKRLENFIPTPPRVAIMSIYGIGGSGKTRFALEFIQKYNQTFEGISPFRTLRRTWIALYMNFNTYLLDDLEKHFIQWKFYHNLIVILDNYHASDKAHEEALKKLEDNFCNKLHKTRIILLSYASFKNPMEEEKKDTDIYLGEISREDLQDIAKKFNLNITDDMYPLSIFILWKGGVEKYIQSLHKDLTIDKENQKALIYIFLRCGGVALSELGVFGIKSSVVLGSKTNPLVEYSHTDERFYITLLDTISFLLGQYMLSDYGEKKDILIPMWKNDAGFAGKIWNSTHLPIQSSVFDLEDECFSKDAELALKRMQETVGEIYFYGSIDENNNEVQKAFTLSQTIAKNHPGNKAIQLELAKGAYNAILYYGKARNFPEMEIVFKRLGELAENHPTNEDIQLALARAIKYMEFYRDNRHG